MNDFNLDFLERTLTLVEYEHIKNLVDDLAEKDYAPARIAAIMFRYGWLSGRKSLRETQKAKREKYISNKEREQQTEAENEGSN